MLRLVVSNVAQHFNRFACLWPRQHGAQYADVLKRHFGDRLDEPLAIVEWGVMRGEGLAIWRKLFTNAHLIGIDHDLSFVEPDAAELHTFDPECSEYDLASVLNGRKVDIFNDAGCFDPVHSYKMARAMIPHMAESFVYFIKKPEIFERLKADRNTKLLDGIACLNSRGLVTLSRNVFRWKPRQSAQSR